MSKIATKTLALFIFSSVITMFLSERASAQMFSVGDPEPTRTQMLGTYTSLTAGWELGSFEYRGDVVDDFDRLDFDDSIFRLALETPGLDISLAFGGALTGMSNNAYVNAEGRIYSSVFLFRRENLIVSVPLQITTDLKRVQQNQSDSEFQQSSFAFGSGLATMIRLGSAADLELKGTPNYGFSFSQGNLFGGSLFRADGRAQLYLRNLIGSRTFILGYNFNFRSYDIDGDRDDYRYTGHRFFLGVAF